MNAFPPRISCSLRTPRFGSPPAPRTGSAPGSSSPASPAASSVGTGIGRSSPRSASYATSSESRRSYSLSLRCMIFLLPALDAAARAAAHAPPSGRIALYALPIARLFARAALAADVHAARTRTGPSVGGGGIRREVGAECERAHVHDACGRDGREVNGGGAVRGWLAGAATAAAEERRARRGLDAQRVARRGRALHCAPVQLSKGSA
jgi:hypothetical protein